MERIEETIREEAGPEPEKEEELEKAMLQLREAFVKSHSIAEWIDLVVIPFSDYLKTKYSQKELLDTYAYHALIGSTPVKTNRFDFEGEDSVFRYITKKTAEFSSANGDR